MEQGLYIAIAFTITSSRPQLNHIHMEIHVHSILAKKDQKEEKENQLPHTPNTHTYPAQTDKHTHMHTQKEQDKPERGETPATTHSGANIPECGATPSNNSLRHI